MSPRQPSCFRGLVGAGALLILAGCGMGGAARIDPSPSYPTLGKARPNRYFASTLRISTDTWIDLNLGSGDDGSVVRPSSYTVYDEHGQKMFFVQNYIGSHDTEPQTMELDPGKYLILLDRPGKHPPVFWVVVEPAKQTEVDLIH